MKPAWVIPSTSSLLYVFCVVPIDNEFITSQVAYFKTSSMFSISATKCKTCYYVTLHGKICKEGCNVENLKYYKPFWLIKYERITVK